MYIDWKSIRLMILNGLEKYKQECDKTKDTFGPDVVDFILDNDPGVEVLRENLINQQVFMFANFSECSRVWNELFHKEGTITNPFRNPEVFTVRVVKNCIEHYLIDSGVYDMWYWYFSYDDIDGIIDKVSNFNYDIHRSKLVTTDKGGTNEKNT